MCAKSSAEKVHGRGDGVDGGILELRELRHGGRRLGGRVQWEGRFDVAREERAAYKEACRFGPAEAGAEGAR